MIEYIPDQATLILWLDHYGSIVLFILLALGIIALPVPEETLMVISGVLIKQGHLILVPTLCAALGGSMCGITVSYIIGKTAGLHLLRRYGSYFGMTDARIQQAHSWFEKYGTWSLFIGYFIPGVRHFTGLTAGISRLQYPSFALFAYTGALFWVTTFISLGYFFGTYGMALFQAVESRVEFVGLFVLIALAAFVMWTRRSNKRTR